MIAGIYRPTRGHVRTHGRIMPLIGLGLGFHPELTGEENVYLNASIFGLSNAETRKIYPEIVAFSGLEAFIDTPLKHYSSGMTARLGFSVAAFLDADILLFDEVLAVGDKDFVQKCNEKIDKFQKRGKTMVLVNHSRDAIRRALHARLFDPQGTVGDARRHRSGVGALCAFRLTLARVGICKRHPERSQKSQRS